MFIARNATGPSVYFCPTGRAFITVKPVTIHMTSLNTPIIPAIKMPLLPTSVLYSRQIGYMCPLVLIILRHLLSSLLVPELQASFAFTSSTKVSIIRLMAIPEI